MPPTATVIRYSDRPFPTIELARLDKPIRWQIKGLATNQDFVYLQQLAKAIADKYSQKTQFSIHPLSKFDHDNLVIQLKPKFPSLIYNGCIVENSDNQAFDFIGFKTIASALYPLDASAISARIESPAAKPKRNVVNMEIDIDGVCVGILTLELFADICPTLVSRFMELVWGKVIEGNPVSYKGCRFERVVPNGWIQLGKIPFAKERYYQTDLLPDENFVVKHDKRGIVSMVNAGPNSNHTEFMVSLKPMAYFDQKYVAIGQLIDGEETLKAIEKIRVVNEKPAQTIEIAKIVELAE